MEYTRLGKTGLAISKVTLGAMGFSGFPNPSSGSTSSTETTFAILDKALELGINFIDTAEMYGSWGRNDDGNYGESESEIGKWFSQESVDREDVVLATKFFFPPKRWPNYNGTGRKNAYRAISGSLERLQTDYVDLYYNHRYDHRTPIEDTVRTMNDLIDQGYIRYWATSSWRSAEIERAWMVAKEYGLEGPIADQCRYNIFDRYSLEVELPYTLEYHQMGTAIWGPMGQGILTGKYNSGFSDDTLDWTKNLMQNNFPNGFPDNLQEILQSLAKLASEYEMSLGQFAQAFALANKYATTVIFGATSVSRVEENANVVELSKKITKDVVSKVEEITKVIPDFNQKPSTQYSSFGSLVNQVMGGFWNR